MKAEQILQRQAEAVTALVAELRAENERLRGEIRKANCCMDMDFNRIKKLEAELYSAEQTIAIQERIQVIREEGE